MRHMRRSSVEPWTENVGETGCIEPAFKQSTNDDDRANENLNLFGHLELFNYLNYNFTLNNFQLIYN